MQANYVQCIVYIAEKKIYIYMDIYGYIYTNNYLCMDMITIIVFIHYIGVLGYILYNDLYE